MAKLNFAGERVLAVVAHPDDAELLCAGTLGRAASDGAEIGVAVMCRGDKGQPSKKIKDLGAVRKKEAKAAAKLLGASLHWLGFDDGALTDGLVERRKLLETYRKFGATLVLAHSPQDYHPDHCAAAAVAESASWFAASPGHKTRSAPLTAPPALWWMDTVNMTGFEPELFIEMSEFLPTKHKMMACHKSQLARAGDTNFTPLGQLMERQAVTRGAQAGVTAAEAFQICRTFKRARAW